uniref:amidohydrolase family protein n=1 Tax=Fusobacterium sp. TaxID=68766 RepID=UPI00261B9B0C
KAVKCDKISFEKLIKIMSENTAKIFGIKNKGKIALGYDADLVIVDMTTEEIISKDDVISKCGWTPYAGFEKGGKIVTTIVRGNVVFNDGKFVNKIGKEVI